MQEGRVIVIGGGPAGLMAAQTAAMYGRRVLLCNRDEQLGRKLLITGKGRCNVTNHCDVNTFIQNINGNQKFMYSAAHQFTPEDTMAFFERAGVPLKTERGNRVFPQSDKASDILRALTAAVKDSGVECRAETVQKLWIEQDRLRGIITEDGTSHAAEAVIVATGGASYPQTGSTGDGYRLARQAGHTVTPLKPSLIPIVTKESWCKKAQGLSLRNVTLTVADSRTGKVVFEELGEMLFTHFGISGPLVLRASAHMRPMEEDRYRLFINLKPALDAGQLDQRILRDFAAQSNRDFGNSLGGLLPRKLIPIIVQLSGIPWECKVNQVTKEMREKLCTLLQKLPLTAKSFRPIEEAIVTHGGVAVTEISPKTMESKKIAGLYFVGEVLDLDAYTGGFNLQIAFSTGYAAGLAVGQTAFS